MHKILTPVLIGMALIWAFFAVMSPEPAASGGNLVSWKKRSATTTSSTTLATTTTTLPSSLAPVGPPGNWSLQFSDEFSGTTLDTTKWATKSYAESDSGQGNLPNQQLEWNQAANCSVGNGMLTITAKPDSITSPMGIKYNWSSCLITSTPSYSFQYAYIEERAKLPSQTGFWPAFWTWQIPGLNKWVETDAYEYYSDNPNRLYLTQHSGLGGGCIWPTTFNPSNDFHVYGVDIAPSGTTWYIDGVKVCYTASTSDGNTNIISNMAVYAGVPPIAGTVATKQVDYIRVWKAI